MKTENMHKWSNSWSPVGRENEEHCTSGMQRRLEIKVKKSRSKQGAESENTFLRTRGDKKGKSGSSCSHQTKGEAVTKMREQMHIFAW